DRRPDALHPGGRGRGGLDARRPDRRRVARRPAATRHLCGRHVGASRGGAAAEGGRTGVAPAMSTTVKPTSDPLWHGEDVTISDVLDALSQVRAKFARDEAGDDELVHPRNCVMTLISVSPTEAHEQVAQRTTQMIGAQHPVQAIVIREEAPLRGHRFDAWITAEVQRPEMCCASECEIRSEERRVGKEWTAGSAVGDEATK